MLDNGNAARLHVQLHTLAVFSTDFLLRSGVRAAPGRSSELGASCPRDGMVWRDQFSQEMNECRSGMRTRAARRVLMAEGLYFGG